MKNSRKVDFFIQRYPFRFQKCFTCSNFFRENYLYLCIELCSDIIHSPNKEIFSYICWWHPGRLRLPRHMSHGAHADIQLFLFFCYAGVWYNNNKNQTALVALYSVHSVKRENKLDSRSDAGLFKVRTD